MKRTKGESKFKNQKLLRGKYLLSSLEISQTPNPWQTVGFSEGTENTCTFVFKPLAYSFQFMLKDFWVFKSFKDISLV